MGRSDEPGHVRCANVVPSHGQPRAEVSKDFSRNKHFLSKRLSTLLAHIVRIPVAILKI
jgi:hypothetical protein